MNSVKSNSAVPFLFFLVWPFGSFVMAVKHFDLQRHSGIILLFSFIFGYTVYQYSGDIIDYRDAFDAVAGYSWSDYSYLITHVLSKDKLLLYEPNVVNTQPDVYALTLQFLVSRVTDNPRWFWAFGSLVFTYFFLRVVKEVRSEIAWIPSLPQRTFFLFFLLVIPFYVGVTGIRFWTALYLFMTFAIPYIRHDRIKFLLLASLSVLVHFSFVIPVVLLFLQRYLKRSRVVSFVLVFSSIVFFSLTSNDRILEVIQENLTFLQDTSIESRVQGYSDKELLDQKKERLAATNWYVTLRQDLILYVLVASFLLEFFGLIRWRNENEFTRKLYPFLLVFFCLTLLSFNLGSVGRFKNIFYLVTLFRYAVLVGLNADSRSLRALGYVLLPVLILHITVIARAGFYFVDPFLLIGNVFTLFFIQSDVSLSEFLIGH